MRRPKVDLQEIRRFLEQKVVQARREGEDLRESLEELRGDSASHYRDHLPPESVEDLILFDLEAAGSRSHPSDKNWAEQASLSEILLESAPSSRD